MKYEFNKDVNQVDCPYRLKLMKGSWASKYMLFKAFHFASLARCSQPDESTISKASSQTEQNHGN
eukprot:4686277-Amphidinium_carterae.1